MGCLGLEPRTIRLKAGYSTIELATLITYYHENIKISRGFIIIDYNFLSNQIIIYNNKVKILFKIIFLLYYF